MINELEALVGILIVIIIIYFFAWRRSKIFGGFALLICSLGMLVPFGGTDYEMIAWVSIFVSMLVTISEFAYAKIGGK